MDRLFFMAAIFSTKLIKALIGCGLKQDDPRCTLSNGRKALHKGIADVFGKDAVIWRCRRRPRSSSPEAPAGSWPCSDA